MRHFIYILITLYFFQYAESQSKFSKWNFAYQYNNTSPVSCNHLILEKNDSLDVFLKIVLSKNDTYYKNFVAQKNVILDYRITSSYDDKKGLASGKIEASLLSVERNTYIFHFSISNPNVSNSYLFIAFFQGEAGEIFVKDIPLSIFEKKAFGKILVFDDYKGVPVFENYISRKDSFIIKSSTKKEGYQLIYTKYNFAPALPPMGNEPTRDNEIKLSPDSILQIYAESRFNISKKGNYSVKSNSGNNEQKINFLVVDNQFPKVTKTKELIDPAIYIASDDERKSLKNSKNPKLKLDNFWLSLGQDKEFSKKMISTYYNAVENANFYFTNYKEGWKTDQGMIYIIFGAPDEVYKNDLKETWRYKKRPQIPALTFIYNKKTGPFDDYYYELENSENYMNIWYNTIELWRRGILDK